MILTNQQEVTYTIDQYGAVNVRTVTLIFSDGVQIAKSNPHRRVIAPGDLYNKETQMTKDILSGLHTPARIAAYRIAQAELNR